MKNRLAQAMKLSGLAVFGVVSAAGAAPVERVAPLSLEAPTFFAPSFGPAVRAANPSLAMPSAPVFALAPAASAPSAALAAPAAAAPAAAVPGGVSAAAVPAVAARAAAAAGAAPRSGAAAPVRAGSPADGLNRMFDGVALEQGRAESMTRTGLLGLSDKIQKTLELTNRPTYKGMSDPAVYIRGLRRDSKTGAPVLSMVGADTAYTYYGGDLSGKNGKAYPGLPVVASWSAKDGQERPSNVRWRPTGRLEKRKLFPVERLSSAGKTALLRAGAEVARRLKLEFGPSFRGKDEPRVRVTGFSIKDGKPTLTITASQDAYTYYGGSIDLPGGKRLRSVTVSAVVVYDPATGRSEVGAVKWLRKGAVVSRGS